MRVSADDLQWAATWLEAYESVEPETDEAYQTAQRMALWLRSQAAKREENAAVRYIARATGATPARVRERLRQTLAENQVDDSITQAPA